MTKNDNHNHHSRCSCHDNDHLLEKETAYRQLTKRLDEERKRRARKLGEPKRGQTSLDQFYIEK